MEEGTEIVQDLEDKQKSCEVLSILDDTVQAATMPYIVNTLSCNKLEEICVRQWSIISEDS